MDDAERRRAIAELEAEGLDVTEWSDDASASYATHAHEHREVRIVLEGALTMIVDGNERELGPGDRMDLESGQEHAARVGPDGVRYLAGTQR